MPKICAVSYSELLNHSASPITFHCIGICVHDCIHKEVKEWPHPREGRSSLVASHHAVWMNDRYKEQKQTALFQFPGRCTSGWGR